MIALLPQSEAPAVLAASADGASWEPLSIVWEALADAALAAGPDGSLWAAYRDDEGGVWVALVGEDGAREAQRVEGARTPFRPAIAWWHGTLVVAITGEDHRLYAARGEGPAGLRFKRAHKFAESCDGPSLAGTPAYVFIAFTGTDGNVYLGSSDDGASFDLVHIEHGGEEGISSRPSLCSWGPHLAVSVVNSEKHLLLATSHQSPSMRLTRVGGGAVSDYTPAIAMTGEAIHVLVAGTDGGLWAASGSPDALSFQPGSLTAGAAPMTVVSREGEPSEPSRATVIPVLFYPSDVAIDEEMLARMRTTIEANMALAQERYRRWLVTDTFPYADTRVVLGQRPHLDYQRGDAWTDIFAEILTSCGECDANSTSFFVALVVRPAGFDGKLWFGSGGSGSNEGSGMVLMDARCILEDEPYRFQSTLVHELGHAFGLPHVDAWDESMESCESIMSYNQRHCVPGPHAPEPEAEFLPEEYLMLGSNEVAFPQFTFDPARHNPTGAPLRKPR